jgi:hypothetical protein
MQNNAQNGLAAVTSTQTINLTVSDSVSASNATDGIFGNTGSEGHVKIMVRTSTIANNAASGLDAIGPGAFIHVTRSTITGNNAGWSVSGGIVGSYVDNNIDGNTSINTEPPTLTYK